MTYSEKFTDGQPCWMDISTPDSAKRIALAEFLTALFGWKFEVGGPESGNYSTALSNGRNVAGLMEMPGVPSYWTTYLHTGDIRSSADAFVSHGGKVLTRPMQIFEMGHMATCQDAVGAVVGLWQPIKFEGFGSHDEENWPTWFDQQSEDPKLAAAFYRDVFGLSVASTPDSDDATLGSPEQTWFSVSHQPAAMPPSWNPVIQVDSLSRVADEMSRLGGEILINDMAVPGGKVLVFNDPVVLAPLICFEVASTSNAT